MSRLGLGWRVAVILIAALVAMQIAVTMIFYIDRDRVTDAGYRPPFADQVAALVGLLDGAPATRQALVLRAVNGPGFRVAIEAGAPPQPAAVLRLERQEQLVRRYLDDRRPRAISVILLGGRHQDEADLPARTLGLRVRATVELAAGNVLVIDLGGGLISRVLGIPPGFLAGLLGLLVALLALFAVAREMKPLNRLAQAVQSFGTALEPQAMKPEGAREVRALIQAVNGMQRRIAALLKGRSFIVGALAHDLRTYLTRLRLRVELLSEDQRPRAVRDIEEMQSLVEDALVFAKAGFAGRTAVPVDLVAVVARECEERAAAGLPVTLQRRCPSAIVLGSVPALARVAANLIDNAVTYGGRADIVLAIADGAAELLVEDRGPGIPESERTAILEPFRRLDDSRNRDLGGTGLGLAIAQDLVHGLGGRIAIEDRPGGGARLRVVLPLAPAGGAAEG